MKRLSIWIATVFAIAATPGVAQADLASLYAEIHSGGAGGAGVGGGALDGSVEGQAFHEKTQGLTYGAQVGIEFLFIDVFAEHNQYLDTGGTLLGTWTQLMAGIDLQKGIGDKKNARFDREKGKRVGGYHAGYIEAGFAVGLGLGTLGSDQVDPPLDNAQIDDKGVIGQAHIGLGYRMSKVISIGLAAPVQYGYLFKNGVPANDTDNQYTSMQYAVMANLRLKFQLK
jgi:hypothetical protein